MKIDPHKQCNAKSKDERTLDWVISMLKTREKTTIIGSESALAASPVLGRKKSLAFLLIFLPTFNSIASKDLIGSDETSSGQSASQTQENRSSTLTSDELPVLPEVNSPRSASEVLQPSRGSQNGDHLGAFPLHRTPHNPQAIILLKRVLQQLVHGPAFHCKVRETVWTNDREVIGVGTYEQAGQGTGRYHLQVTMHDGSGRHRLKQISDGRLAWTRTEIASGITLKRVDVGRLEEWVGKAGSSPLIAPRYTVGAWVELLTSLARDYTLDLVGATLEGKSVWVIKGEINSQRRSEIMSQSGRTSWPVLFPTRVHVAIGSSSNNAQEDGNLLPLRFEFWSDAESPITNQLKSDNQSGKNNEPQIQEEPTRQMGSRLITLIELYAIQPIIAPPVERFRFENQEAEVNFINETDRYIQMHGIQLTEREKHRLRR